ncbi:hypothetical protein KC360_g7738 [Hortaea werneckii]|nr:hypothetical protein KC325_g7747 [Hortaea werneckii]KAI6987900.1 hypothetical protein KC359_g8049 [Hortaea werneckii]KAI7141828.1 hypothetical protein KC344_g7708 [Hortaea werneckii]KAI7169009.1 hypothetical protein KC360_g7738 [Hortaea werneckii]KAI7505227.1 hypothetical protein KC347_g8051 [Hortaea werneckii]
MDSAPRVTRSSQRRKVDEIDVESSEVGDDVCDPMENTTNAASSEDIEQVDADDQCPICHLLLYRPVVTHCNHAMCESCMAHWADVSVTSQMKIVDVDEEPSEFNPVSGVEAKCPMCRTATSASLDEARSERLRARYPEMWEERKVEEEGDSSRFAAEIQTITVYIGNRHAVVRDAEDANVHEWTFFVRPSRTDIIEEVQILLHPTFRQSRIIRQRPPYAIKRYGWGYFTIQAYVILKAGYSWVSNEAEDSPDGASKGMLPLEWTLDFSGFGGKGSMGRCRLKVKNDRDWEDISEEGEQDEAEMRRLVRQYERDGRYQPPEED